MGGAFRPPPEVAASGKPTSQPEVELNRRTIGFLVVLGLCAIVAISLSRQMRLAAEQQLRAQVHAAQEDVNNRPKPDVTSEAIIESGSTFVEALQLLGIDPVSAHNLVEAARPVFNFRRVRRGNKIVLTRTYDGELRSVKYNIDASSDLWIRAGEDGFRAEIQEVPSTTEIVGLRGELKTSLFDSILEMGETPELAVRLAEIFAWDLDFYSDPQPGDTFRIVVEKKQYESGAAPIYGRILMAEYNNAGRLYTAVLFRDRFGKPAYYSADGKSLQKAFLRSPLKFEARISSHFSRSRFHPILHVRRAHLGTDYAAPTGTPVQAVANGRVVWSGRKGGNGIMVQIAHSRGYQSYYLHLSRALVHRGQSVRQGQIIGRVGSTGLASGPHLDFRIQRGAQFVNWERMHLPPAEPVPPKDVPEFMAERDRWAAILPSFQQAPSAVATSTNSNTVPTAAGSH
jgi:murein DD-endopeptidase MepM/ murein hydrolase activator NlpD